MALCPGANVISETLDGEVVMIDLNTGAYFSLGGTGGEIWTLIERRYNRDALISSLADAYPDERSGVAATVSDFLEELQREGLVGETDDQSPASDPSPVGHPGGGFEAPKLEKFTDMAHVILIDPVHDVDVERGWPNLKE